MIFNTSWEYKKWYIINSNVGHHCVNNIYFSIEIKVPNCRTSFRWMVDCSLAFYSWHGLKVMIYIYMYSQTLLISFSDRRHFKVITTTVLNLLCLDSRVLLNSRDSLQTSLLSDDIQNRSFAISRLPTKKTSLHNSHTIKRLTVLIAGAFEQLEKIAWHWKDYIMPNSFPCVLDKQVVQTLSHHRNI